jgi:hypothetical protein
MGRPKGSGNKTPAARAFVARVERLLAKGGMSGGLEALACRFITGDDIKTGFGVWRTLMGYKFGLPTQPLEHSGALSYTETLTKMRQKRDHHESSE